MIGGAEASHGRGRRREESALTKEAASPVRLLEVFGLKVHLRIAERIVRAIDDVVVNFLVRIDDRGNDFGILETEENEIIAAFMAQNFREHDVRLEIIDFVDVVLHERNRLRERGARYENRSDPVVNDSAGHFNGFAIVERSEPLDYDLSTHQLFLNRRTLWLRQPLDPQVWPAALR